MKKRILSVLLVAAMLLGVVTVGLSSLTAAASAAGKGAEELNVFSLTPSSLSTYGSNATTIKIRSLDPNYKVYVNSISAYLPYAPNSSASVSYTTGTVCDSEGGLFTVTPNMASGESSVVRYTCSYNILDKQNRLVYSNLTGYGYGAFGAYWSGTSGESIFKKYDGDRGFVTYDKLGSVYVQVGNFSLNYVTETDGWSFAGEKNIDPNIAGNKPSSLNFGRITFRSGNVQTLQHSGIWAAMTTPASGYYSFDIFYNGIMYGVHHCEMYYLDGGLRSKAIMSSLSYLGKNLEKRYYTSESWNAYLSALDEAFNVAYCFYSPSYGFRCACEAAYAGSTGNNIQKALDDLQQEKADYTVVNNAVASFNAVKDDKVDVVSYNPDGATGTYQIGKYSSSSLAAAQSAIDAVPSNLYAADQESLQQYADNINSAVNNLQLNSACYTELDKAISDCSKYSDMQVYTPYSKSVFDGALSNAQNCNRGYQCNNQSVINACVTNLTSARDSLEHKGANLTALNNAYAKGYEITQDLSSFITTLDGYNEVYAEFVASFNSAEALVSEHASSTIPITRQSEIDAASTRLAKANEYMYEYKRLDIDSELMPALNLTPEFDRSFYIPSSYNAWESIRAEAAAFMVAAFNTPYTYTRYNEMTMLVSSLTSAYNNLELKKADFTSITNALNTIPDMATINLYVDEVAQPLKDLIAQVDYGTTIDKQSEVDTLAQNILQAATLLTPDKYRTADYSGVRTAIARAGELNPANYEDFSGVTDAIDAVDYNVVITQQETVDAMADAINEAIDSLVPVSADYTVVNNAISLAESVEHPEYYRNFDLVTAAINDVDWNKNIFEQVEVNEMASRIVDAVNGLVLDDADYSGVEDAIADSKSEDVLGNISDYTDESLDVLDKAVSSVVGGYTKDRQSEVDAMEAAIRQAMADLVLKGADYTEIDNLIRTVSQIDRGNYRDMTVLDNAINAVDRTKNIRQQDDVSLMAQAIRTAMSQIQLKSADYTNVDNAINQGLTLINESEYEYTQASLDNFNGVVNSVDRTKDILSQADVDAYVPLILAAIEALEYVDADYSAVDLAVAEAEGLNRNDFTTEALEAVDIAVGNVKRGYKIDRQSEVDAMAAAINNALDSLQYKAADYTAVNTALEAYNAIVRDYYYQSDLDVIDAVVTNDIHLGYLKDRQSEVDAMAVALNNALNTLYSKIKPSDTRALNKAVSDANDKIMEMSGTGYEIEPVSLNNLSSLMSQAMYFADTDISAQADIDELTDKIIEATQNLEFAFCITEESTVIIEENLIFGVEEGITKSELESKISFVGNVTMSIEPTRKGLGTGSKIVFTDKNGDTVAEYSLVIFGDADGDGFIDTFDVAFVSEIANYSYEADDILARALDVNLDSVVDVYDLSIIVSLANMETSISQDGNCVIS